MNIALTGSSGLLGSHLCNDLKKMGHNILCISSSKSSPQDQIYSYQQILSGDLNIQVDYILHLATINSNLSESQISHEVNLAKKVIHCMEALGCSNLVFFSSIKVYGENTFNNTQKISETSLLKPRCFYGKAKAQCEQIIAESALKKNFSYLIFRLPPVLINHPKSNLRKLFQIVEKGLPIPSFRIGDKNQRSFLSYDLLIDVLKIALSNSGKLNNSPINLSDFYPISTNNLLRRFGNSIDKPAMIFYLPNFLFQAMMKVNRLQLILVRLFGNFYISNDKLQKEFQLPKNNEE